MTYVDDPSASLREASCSRGTDASAWTFVVAWSDDGGGSLEPLIVSVRGARDLEDAVAAAAEHLAGVYNADNASAVSGREVFPGPDPGHSAIAHVIYMHPGPPAAQPPLPFSLDGIRIELDAAGRAAGTHQPAPAGGAA